MTNKEITTYLNDHLAGSVAGLELLGHLIEHYQGQQLEGFFVDLQREIKADQDVLEGLLAGADETESVFRQLGAWVAEKFARTKFKIAGQEIGGLGLLQALEMLDLGIRGKQLLWRALAKSNWQPLRDVDLVQLEQRSIEQQQRVEHQRLAAASEAFRIKKD